MRRNLFAIVFLLVVVFGYFLLKPNQPNKTPAISSPSSQEQQVPIVGRIGEGYFNFEVADTDTERIQGLSGRTSLSGTDALLFVFDTAGKHCFWMKDMKFNIDIMWFDANKKLVHEKRNVAPETFPESFCPDVAAKYVVEVSAGVAEKNQVKLGSVLDVEL